MRTAASKRFWVLALASAGACAGGSAYADEYHYKSILIGDRAAGLGGAYTAISDDPSGIFYNPAGIVFGFENYISGSANTYNSAQTRYKSVAGGQDYVLSSNGIIPSFFGFSQNIGKDKLAFGIAIPNSDSINQDDTLSDITTTAKDVNTLKRRYFQQDATYLFGPAYSRALGERASIGISLLGFYRTGLAIDNQLILYNPVPAGAYYIQDTYVSESAYGIQPRLGAQLMISDRFAAGADVSKNVNFGGTKSVRSQASNTASGVPVTQDGSYSADFNTSNNTSPWGTAVPWDFETGLAFFPSKTLLFSADVDFYTGDGSSSFNDFKVVPTWNAAVGCEAYLNSRIVLRTGIYTDNAATPPVSSQLVNQATNVNLYGGSLALAVINPGSSISLGAAYSRGSGQGQVISNTTLVQSVDQYNLTVALSGSYHL